MGAASRRCARVGPISCASVRPSAWRCTAAVVAREALIPRRRVVVDQPAGRPALLLLCEAMDVSAAKGGACSSAHFISVNMRHLSGRCGRNDQDPSPTLVLYRRDAPRPDVIAPFSIFSPPRPVSANSLYAIRASSAHTVLSRCERMRSRLAAAPESALSLCLSY